MEDSSKSWFSDAESDNDNFVDIQSELNSDDHPSLLAEGEACTSSLGRRNSEEVTQKLINLSAVVPGPNEIDEVTVVLKTIKYIKELQETVNLLEDQLVPATEDTGSSHRPGKFFGYNHEMGTSVAILPDIEARFLDKEVLVRIHCRKSQGLLVNILNHLENLHLSPTHNDVLSFGSSHLDITIVAQMEDGFTMTVQELNTSLRMAFSPSH